jgi:WD40 repeat protein
VIWETTTGKEITRMASDDSANSVAFSPDGRYVVSGSTDKSLRIWELATGKEVMRRTLGDSVNSVVFSSDSRYILSGGSDGLTRVWDVTTGNEIARMTFGGSVNSVAFSPDGKYVLSGSSDTFAHMSYWQIDDLIAEACKRLSRNLTHEEWAQFVIDQPYRATCVNLPAIPEATPTSFQEP